MSCRLLEFVKDFKRLRLAITSITIQTVFKVLFLSSDNFPVNLKLRETLGNTTFTFMKYNEVCIKKKTSTKDREA